MTYRITAARARNIAAAIGGVLIATGAGISLRSVLRDHWWLNGTDTGLYVRAAQGIVRGISPNDPSLYATLYRYVYPPLFAELMIVPLAVVGAPAWRAIWWLTCVGCLACGVLVLLRGFARRLPWPWALLTLGVIMCSHVVENDLYHGEINTLLLALLVGGLRGYLRGRGRLAVILWGVAIAMKPFLVVLILFPLWRRDWQAATSTLATSAGLTVLSFLILGPMRIVSIVRGYLAVTQLFSGPTLGAGSDNLSLHGLAVRLFDTNLYASAWRNSSFVVYLLDALILAILVGAAWRVARARTEGDAHALLGFAFVLAAGMTFGPFTEADHLLLLLPGLAAATALAFPTDGRPQPYARPTFMVWVALFVAVLGPTASTMLAGAALSGHHLAGLAILWTGRIGLLLLAVVLVTARSIAYWPGGSAAALGQHLPALSGAHPSMSS